MADGTAVVTGVPGWLGTKLVEALVNGASFRAITTTPGRVRCVAQPGIDVSPLEKLGERVEIVRADLRDERAVADVCRGASIVYHAAGIIHPRKVQDLYDINVAGTRNILASAIAGKAKRFILVSSNSPAGLNEFASRLMTEDRRRSAPPLPQLWALQTASRMARERCAPHGAHRRRDSPPVLVLWAESTGASESLLHDDQRWQAHRFRPR